MQMVRNILIILLLLPLAVMIFMPKKELYYLMEHKLKEQNIVISGETLKEGLLSLTIENPVVYIGGAPLAKAEKITLWSLLVYTRLDARELLVAEGLPAELKFQSVGARYSIVSPTNIYLEGLGSLGTIEGNVDLLDRTVQIVIPEDAEVAALSKYLKKGDKGWVYESKF